MEGSKLRVHGCDRRGLGHGATWSERTKPGPVAVPEPWFITLAGGPFCEFSTERPGLRSDKLGVGLYISLPLSLSLSLSLLSHAFRHTPGKHALLSLEMALLCDPVPVSKC